MDMTAEHPWPRICDLSALYAEHNYRKTYYGGTNLLVLAAIFLLTESSDGEPLYIFDITQSARQMNPAVMPVALEARHIDDKSINRSIYALRAYKAIEIVSAQKRTIQLTSEMLAKKDRFFVANNVRRFRKINE